MPKSERDQWYRDDQGVPHGIVRARLTLADVFSVAPQSVEKWGFPREPDGSFDLEKIYHWRNRHKVPVDKEKADRSDHLVRKTAAEAEIKELEAEKRRRELAQMDADLVDRGDVTRFVGKFFLVARMEVAVENGASAAAQNGGFGSRKRSHLALLAHLTGRFFGFDRAF